MKLQINKDFYKAKKFWVLVALLASMIFPQVRDLADDVIDISAIEAVLE